MLPLRVEVIDRCIGDAHFFIDIISVTPDGGRLTADSLYAMDGGHVAKDAVAFRRFDIEQQPGDGVGVGGVARLAAAGGWRSIWD